MEVSDFTNNALSNSIAEHITKQIITGDLKPGEKLIENNYAEEYGTSRAPVREAIYLLATEGLVERIPRKGAVVKEYTENEIYDLLDVRTMLENMAMDRIKKLGVDSDLLQEMKQLHEKMKTVKDVHAYTQLNHSFHMCLLEMSKSEIIKDMYLRLGWPLLRVQSLSFAREGKIEKSITEHELIISLLVKQDMEKLAAVLLNHNIDVISNIQKILHS